MRQIEVRFTEVYRINGRLVVANSIEGDINTWREWMKPTTQDIRSIERMGNDSYQAVGDDALVIAEELCGDMTNELTEELARKSEEIEKLTYDLEKCKAYCDDLERKNQELSACAGK